MALAMTDICATIPLGIFMIWLNASATTVEPWISWADTHFNFSRVEQIPAFLWRSNHLLVVAVEFSRWISPICSFIFFGFFGFASESRRNYRLAWRWAGKQLPFLRRTSTSPNKSIGCVGHIFRLVSVINLIFI
jgi:pheromone a factor receptor